MQYFRDLREAMDGGTLTPATVVEVMGRYATEPATDYAQEN